jgi:hypothetical protein
VVDAQIACDADDPGLEVRAPIERVERFEDLQEDVLREILRLVVFSDELIRDIEHLTPVLTDHRFPGGLVAAQALLNEAVGRRRLQRR